MRRVFTSQRLETVEGVAKLLQEAGIGVHISHSRSYRSRRGGQFSYAEPVASGRQPAVWVRKPEDQPRARALLREAGLLETTRAGLGTSAIGGRFRSEFDEDERGTRWAWRLRILLLTAIAVVALLLWARHPRSPHQSETAAPADAASEIRVKISPATSDSP